MFGTKRFVLAVTASALVATVACGGDKQTDKVFQVFTPDAVTRTPVPGTTPVTNDPALARALLTASDLGPSWTEPAPTGAATKARNLFCGEDTGISTDGAYVLLVEQHDFLIEALSVYQPGSAERVLARLRELTRSCRNFVSTDGAARTDWSIEPTDFASYGDESVSLKGRATLFAPNTSSDAYLIFVRSGDFILLVIDAAPSQLNRSTTEEIVRLAEDKLRREFPDGPP